MVYWLAFFISTAALAETATTPLGQPITINLAPQGAQKPTASTILDDKVFDSVGQVEPRSAPSVAPAADYNSQQYAEWVEACQKHQGVNGKKFRECFQKQKENSRRDLKERFETVEQNQRKGDLPPITDTVLPRKPASADPEPEND
jgi:hypothetical protein